MSSRSANLATWRSVYGVDRRKARRLRRTMARTGSRPCPHPGCLLRGERQHVVHFVPGRGTVIG